MGCCSMERYPGRILLYRIDPGLSHGLLGDLLTDAGKLRDRQFAVVVRQVVIDTGIPQALLDAVSCYYKYALKFLLIDG